MSSGAFASCPEPGDHIDAVVVSGPELIKPQSWDVVAHGEFAAPCTAWARQLGGVQPVSGYLPSAPSARFDLEGMGPHILMVMAEASCDPRLVVRTGDGVWHVGEPANGRQEIVVWSAQDGPMQVWVGAGSQTQCHAKVILETFDR